MVIVRIEDILKKTEQSCMEGNKCLDPETATYNNVINVVTKSGENNSAEKT